MQNKPVAFISFQEQDNLGIGYIASVLLQNGFKAKNISGGMLSLAHNYLLNTNPLGAKT